jgi:hypothetical protein
VLEASTGWMLTEAAKSAARHRSAPLNDRPGAIILFCSGKFYIWWRPIKASDELVGELAHSSAPATVALAGGTDKQGSTPIVAVPMPVEVYSLPYSDRSDCPPTTNSTRALLAQVYHEPTGNPAALSNIKHH